MRLALLHRHLARRAFNQKPRKPVCDNYWVNMAMVKTRERKFKCHMIWTCFTHSSLPQSSWKRHSHTSRRTLTIHSLYFQLSLRHQILSINEAQIFLAPSRCIDQSAQTDVNDDCRWQIPSDERTGLALYKTWMRWTQDNNIMMEKDSTHPSLATFCFTLFHLSLSWWTMK